MQHNDVRPLPEDGDPFKVLDLMERDIDLPSSQPRTVGSEGYGGMTGRIAHSKT